MRREKPVRELVANAEKLQYLSLLPANIQTLKIGELEPDPYSSDEEIEYISFDTPINRIKVLGDCTNQSQPTKEPSKEPVNRILRRRIKKEKEYAASKNVRFGEWEPVRENPASAPPIVTPSTAPETAMLDADTTMAKKSIERKKYPRVVNVLKESVGATTIIKRILDL